MKAALRGAVEERLRGRIERVERFAGGDINEAFLLTLQDRAQVFVKTRSDAPHAMFAAEARGLDWLREAGSLRVPRVLSVSEGEQPPFLVLEFLSSAPRVSDFDERLGRDLATLHIYGAPCFGLDHDNFIGNLPQQNRVQPSWHEFYREARLEPQVERAARARLLDESALRGFHALYARLPDLVGPPEPPARLHGDLWGGNLHVDERGEPCLIDPAVYGGHREVDLAMMRLFGGFGRRVFRAYEETYPLSPGHEERVSLYQLYPLLVHVNLFGHGYVPQLLAALGHYV